MEPAEEKKDGPIRFPVWFITLAVGLFISAVSGTYQIGRVITSLQLETAWSHTMAEKLDARLERLERLEREQAPTVALCALMLRPTSSGSP